MRDGGSDLLPPDDDPGAYMRFEQACAVEVSDFDPVANELIDEAEAKANDLYEWAKFYS